ncbi:hypothetical protein KK449_07715 [Clostridioides difficile]|nr:hypothetical protein [Clostridioides difficile]
MPTLIPNCPAASPTALISTAVCGIFLDKSMIFFLNVLISASLAFTVF